MSGGAKKPAWVIDKERAKRAAASETVWLFGLHAVRDALLNPARQKLRLVLTKNAFDKLEDAVSQAGIEPEIVDPRKFSVPIDEGSVHQGAALEVKPLNWGKLADVAISGQGAPLVVLLDRVTDPHNAGAILRSAEVFGARAVIAPARHSAPETGALAKAASGALERQPYVRVRNLATALEEHMHAGGNARVAHQCLPVLPKPAAPRSLSSKESTTMKATCSTGTTTSWAMRSRGWIVKCSWPRFQVETKICPW